MEMKNCLLVCFVYSALTLGSSQEELEQDSIAVHPTVLEDREDNSNKLLFIHDGFSLKLKKASVLSKRLLLHDATSEGVIDRYVDGEYYEKNLYQNAEKLAALLVKPQAQGDYHIVGYVNATHRIEPLIGLERSLSGRTLHKLSRVDLWKSSRGNIRKTRITRPRIHWPTKPEKKLQLPEKFTIETVFISDSSHAAAFKNETDHTEYVMALMLGVSLRLQLLSPPGFISLTSIQRSSTEKDKIYVTLSSDGKLAAKPTMNKIGNHAMFDLELRAADAVYLATSRRMVVDVGSSTKTGDHLGMANIGGVCGYGKGAVGRDEPFTYSGLSVAVHEIGHLLGLNHDGEKDSAACSSKGGNIMHPYDGGERHYDWSPCSRRAVKRLLQLPTSECLHSITSSYSDLLPNDTVKPGSVIDGKDYCQKYFQNYKEVSYVEVAGTENCYFRCLFLNAKGEKKQADIPAPDGTPCNKNQLNMKCNQGFCFPERNKA